MICLQLSLAQSQPQVTTLFQDQLRSTRPHKNDHKFLQVVQMNSDNSIWVYLRNILEIHDLDKGDFSFNITEQIAMTPASFQSLYKCITKSSDSCSFAGYNRSWIDASKFHEGSLPFRLTIRERRYKNETQAVFRGINLDGDEYKYLLNIASEVMNRSGL